MLEARHFRKRAMIVKMRARLRGARDGIESRAAREQREERVGADRATAELGVRNEERGACAALERPVHRAESGFELAFPIAFGVGPSATELAARADFIVFEATRVKPEPAHAKRVMRGVVVRSDVRR